jgi:hypothetical protein
MTFLYLAPEQCGVCDKCKKNLIPATCNGPVRSKTNLILNYKFALLALAQIKYAQGQYND